MNKRITKILRRLATENKIDYRKVKKFYTLGMIDIKRRQL